MSLIALFVGLVIAFNGYRWFLLLLPIFGFFLGFGIGVDTLQALFGTGMFATVTGWVVGFFVGLVFAVLSYLFYIVGVAFIGGSLGYAIGVGLMGLIGFDPGFITWLVGIILGVVMAFVTLALNVQKWVIIAATSLGGAGVIVGTMLAMFGIISVTDLGAGAVKAAVADSFLWLLFYLAIAVTGFVSQYYTNKSYVIEAPPNRI
jgi:hypothetical protein